MGQATAQLPDPLKAAAQANHAAAGAPPSQASAASADDLLAQLAGEEIDRLLAEADAERPTRAVIEPSGGDGPARISPRGPAPRIAPAPTLPDAKSAAPTTPAKDETTIARELDELFDEIDSEKRPKPPAVAATETATPPAIAAPAPAPAVADLTALPAAVPPEAGRIVIEGAAAAETQKLIVGPASDAPAPGGIAPEPEAPAATTTISEMATGGAEAAALRGDVPAEAATSSALLDEIAAEDLGPAPIYVKMLELLNFPFAALPETLRDLLGKVAILTLFNSLAVLAYVLLFRRHH